MTWALFLAGPPDTGPPLGNQDGVGRRQIRGRVTAEDELPPDRPRPGPGRHGGKRAHGSGNPARPASPGCASPRPPARPGPAGRPGSPPAPPRAQPPAAPPPPAPPPPAPPQPAAPPSRATLHPPV